MRRAHAILLASLAAAALPAAKPVPPGDAPGGAAVDDGRERWRGQAISVCVADLRAIPDLSPDDLESICGCAADRFLDGNGRAMLPPVGPGQLPPMLQGQRLACTARIRPESASAVARLGMAARRIQPPVAETPPADAKPPPDADTAAPAGTESGGESGGFWNWVRSLSLPAWLTGASFLWWIAIGILLFGLLLMKIRRRDPRNDLTGPPAHMRRGAPPQPPRRPDLPR